MPNELVPAKLLQEFKDGRCVFFIGSGVSTECGLISGQALKQILLDELEYPDNCAPLSKVAQSYANISGPPALMNMIREKFGADSNTTENSYKLVAELVKDNYCSHILTTNYDHLIEDALKKVECRYCRSKSDDDLALASFHPKTSLV